jgi:protein involved in polysaccharide export with SLBB domain
MGKRIVRLALSALMIAYAAVPIVSAQTHSQAVSASVDESRSRTAAHDVIADTRPLDPAATPSPRDEAAVQSQINAVYRGFYNSYRLGPGDIVAIYIDKHPDDSVQRVTVSPVGRVYFPLLGDISVVGRILPQLQEYLTNSVGEFRKEPRVALALLEAQSAKIGVLGDVKIRG